MRKYISITLLFSLLTFKGGFTQTVEPTTSFDQDVHDFGIIREGLSSEISNILPLLVQKASGIIEEWFKKAIYI